MFLAYLLPPCTKRKHWKLFHFLYWTIAARISFIKWQLLECGWSRGKYLHFFKISSITNLDKKVLPFDNISSFYPTEIVNTLSKLSCLGLSGKHPMLRLIDFRNKLNHCQNRTYTIYSHLRLLSVKNKLHKKFSQPYSFKSFINICMGLADNNSISSECQNMKLSIK